MCSSKKFVCLRSPTIDFIYLDFVAMHLCLLLHFMCFQLKSERKKKHEKDNKKTIKRSCYSMWVCHFVVVFFFFSLRFVPFYTSATHSNIFFRFVSSSFRFLFAIKRCNFVNFSVFSSSLFFLSLFRNLDISPIWRKKTKNRVHLGVFVEERLLHCFVIRVIGVVFFFNYFHKNSFCCRDENEVKYT